MDGEQLIREISKVSGFTIKDTRVFYDAFCSVLSDCVETRTPISAYGFCNLTFTIVKSRKGNKLSSVVARKQDPTVMIEQIEYPETVRATLKLADGLKEKLRKSVKEDDGFIG